MASEPDKPARSVADLVEATGGRLLDGSGKVPATEARLRHLRDPLEALASGASAEDVVVVPRALPAGLNLPGWPGLLVLAEADAPTEALPCPVLVVRDTRLAFARLSALFYRAAAPRPGIHPTAVVEPGAEVAEDAAIEAGAIVGAGAVVGGGCVVGKHCVVGAGATLGPSCRLHANVTLYPGVRLGARVELHSGCVIGADGFGYAAGPRGAEKVHHGGTVVIDDDVEIGANTTVDRATLGATRIGARTKIDNLCTVAHNVVIGTDCLIAGKVGIAGSSRIGDRVIIGGGAGITDHVTVNDDARIGGLAGVSKDVPKGEAWSGTPAKPLKQVVRDLYLRGRLEEIWRHVRSAERSRERGDAETADDA